MARKPVTASSTSVASASGTTKPRAATRTTSKRSSPAPRAAKPKPAGSEPAAPVSHDAIRDRAYFLFTAGTPGGQLDHWLQAERELQAK